LRQVLHFHECNYTKKELSRALFAMCFTYVVKS
jgi:hypothetical protein